ncbi:MAG: UDP-N-acetylmuramate--L-alanine ligase [Methylococcales bacterium]|jgi:UDP-N-acetylmuramate--alanine ligase|nr:UDP-N-acetylmuramate--L-alanine ligase [Methylococcales bacterium]MBT7408571.1 UDP-N-acetylmuramate--L-alanine ligase [Methylococcales bacterium]
MRQDQHIVKIVDSIMDRSRNVHMIGIGGSGMGGIAEVLHNLEYNVSGSDLNDNAVTERLSSLGIKITKGHFKESIENCDVVVISSAVNNENPEVMAAREQKIPVIPRAEMLAELMRFRYGIAVAGTHGKTTTTSLVASLLAEAKLDPTYVIGGLLNSSGSHSKLGTGHYLVAEADESDASFLYLQPMMSIVTNIDMDHMGTYGGDFNKLKETFIEFIHHLPFYGLAVLCNEDENIRALLPQLSKPYITYGLDSSADIWAHDIDQNGVETHFSVSRKNKSNWLRVTLNMPGVHNVLNALSAIAIAAELNVSDESILSALKYFQGIGRRFQTQGDCEINSKKVMFIDDYGHHPREIDATILAVREGWPDRRLVLVFQPHRYSRTRDLFEDFVNVLSKTDVLLLTEVFAAGEDPVITADGRSLSRSIRNRAEIDPIFVESLENVPKILAGVIQNDDIILTMGAGSIGSLSIDLKNKILKIEK